MARKPFTSRDERPEYRYAEFMEALLAGDIVAERLVETRGPEGVTMVYEEPEGRAPARARTVSTA